ncbi:hypothetical protein DBZ36_06210 [Alginatibacterium sediminis]|uniref:DUF1835 domain-containing protein n=1 Tax=Alginatibacterium sediminis TaxID=2164068 RepID=A0A420EH39_9ALTE|nr:hypothetical protein [Alginatibacterium sediminis]RKF20041.1 hypothetical protein DBZ36_06210 [Alginatibacterium sediminis]
MRRLIITNGDCAVAVMQSAGFEAEILAWRDVLHEGQIDSRLELESLSHLRASHIANLGWAEFEQVSLDFKTRDSVLKDWHAFDHIELWFEHDMYDQLQVLQILHFFSLSKILRSSTTLSLLDNATYLGRCTASSIRDLTPKLKPVDQIQLELANSAWLAFGFENPELWSLLKQRDLSALPFLSSCVTRVMQEYPCIHTGLSRSEFQALQVIGSGIVKPGKVFAACQQLEEAIYMGDLSFMLVLNALMDKPEPLIKSSLEGQQICASNFASHKLSITSKGQSLLGTTGSFTTKSQIWERWLGGVYLNKSTVWRWDDQRKLLIDITAA